LTTALLSRSILQPIGSLSLAVSRGLTSSAKRARPAPKQQNLLIQLALGRE